MKTAYAASLMAALACHTLVLFGFKMDETASHPLAISEEPREVEVNLVAAPPEESTPAPPPETPLPEITPALDATPEPPSAPGPPTDMPAQEIVSPPAPVEMPTPHVAPRAPQKGATTSTATSKSRSVQASPAGITTAASYRSNPKPDYPDEARRLHQQGVVLLSVQVGIDGRVIALSLKRSCGFPALDHAALVTVQRWTFEPARSGALPVASRVDVPVRFGLSQ